MDGKKIQRKSLTLLEALDKILEHAKGSQLSVALYRKIKRYTDCIGKRLDLSLGGDLYPN